MQIRTPPAHIGIVACSAEGAALCYRIICREAAAVLGQHTHPEISLHSYSLSSYMECIERGDWAGVAELMLSSAHTLEMCGAEFLICPDNTIHRAWPYLAGRSRLPWLHIAEEVAAEAGRRGFARLGILGTRYTMEGPVYPEVLGRWNIDFRVPSPGDREIVDRIIFEELVGGVLTVDSLEIFLDIIDGLRRDGCDAVVLGCTEIPLLVAAADSSLPTLDSTRILAFAALRRSLTSGPAG